MIFSQDTNSKTLRGIKFRIGLQEIKKLNAFGEQNKGIWILSLNCTFSQINVEAMECTSIFCFFDPDC